MDQVDRVYYRMLLKTMLRLDDYAAAAGFNLRDVVPADVLAFWSEEKATAIAEARGTKPADHKAAALAKLTDEERKALGIT